MIPPRGNRLLLALAALFCAARFAGLSSAPFINDEPHFQLMLDEHLKNGTFPWVALHGNKGVTYGATALWFYYPLRLLTSSVNAIAAWHLVLFLTGFAVLILAARKAAGETAAAWMALFAASSPYLFFYSRLPWDNTFFVLLAALACHCLVEIERNPNWIWFAALGAVCGLIFDLHLMGIPVIAAALLTCLPVFRSKPPGSGPAIKAASKAAAAFAAPFLAIAIPYLRLVKGSLTEGPSHFAIPAPGRSVEYLKGFVSWPGRGYLSRSGMTYFFEGFAESALPDPALLLFAAAFIAMGLTCWKLLRGPRGSVSALERFGILSFALTGFYYLGTGPDLRHPHYFMPIWWVVLLFAALAIARSQGLLQLLLGAAGAGVVLVNLIFLLSAYRWIDRNHGTRGIHFGPLRSEGERTVSEICQDIRSRFPDAPGLVPVSIDTSSVAGIFPYFLEYAFQHQTPCAGRIALTSIPAGGPPVQRFALQYQTARGPDAALTWRRIP